MKIIFEKSVNIHSNWPHSWSSTSMRNTKWFM